MRNLHDVFPRLLARTNTRRALQVHFVDRKVVAGPTAGRFGVLLRVNRRAQLTANDATMPSTVLSWQPNTCRDRRSHRQLNPCTQRAAALRHPVRCQASALTGAPPAALLHRHTSHAETDLQYLRQAAALSASSAGLTQPHPNAGCVLTTADGIVVAETFQRAQGTEPPEVQAVRHAQGGAAGSTAYLNLESGDCHGETAAVQALIGRCV